MKHNDILHTKNMFFILTMIVAAWIMERLTRSPKADLEYNANK